MPHCDIVVRQVTKLVENYRSHPALINLSSEIFYNNELVVSAEKSLIESLCPWDKLPNHEFPILFHGIRVRSCFTVVICSDCGRYYNVPVINGFI